MPSASLSSRPPPKPRHMAVRRLALRCLLCAALAVFGANAWGGASSWTINGKSMPLVEFITQVAEITGKTVVLDPRVKNQEITVLSDVPLDSDGVYALFLTVLKVNGLGAVEADGVVSVVQQGATRQSSGPVADDGELPADMLVTRVVPTSYVAAAEVVKALRPLVPQTGVITSIENPNVLIVADQAGNMRRLLALVAQLDVVDTDEVVRRGLEHAWVGTLATVLEKIAPDRIGNAASGPQRVLMVANERDNSLILKGKPHVIAETLRLIDKLDVPDESTNPSQVIHLNHADAVAVAELLDRLVNETSGGDPESPTAIIQAYESLNALIIRADPGTMQEVLATVGQLDVRRAQVLIEAAVVEISLTKVRTQGVELAGGDRGGSGAPAFSTTLSGIIGGVLQQVGGDAEALTTGIDPLAIAAGFASPTIALSRVKGDGFFFGALVTALASDTRANLLSTPSVLTLDNEEATNVSGQQIPFRTGSFTTTTDGASNPFQTINRENVGVELTVTPHIHDDLSMRMAIKLEVGNVADSDALGGVGIGNTGFADIVTNNRSLETTILVDDQQIIMLGGLIQDDYSNVGRRVPLLADIPGLGRAFRSKRKTQVKRHLLMFLRPSVLLSAEDAAATAARRYQGIYRLRGEDDLTVPPNLPDVFEPPAENGET